MSCVLQNLCTKKFLNPDAFFLLYGPYWFVKVYLGLKKWDILSQAPDLKVRKLRSIQLLNASKISENEHFVSCTGAGSRVDSTTCP